MGERERTAGGISDDMPEARNTGSRAGAAAAEPQRSSLYFVWQGIRSDPMAMLGAVMLGAFIFCALFAPLISPYGPNEADPFLRLRGLGTEGHPLGLDNQGRDMLTRLVFGTRMSLITGFGPVLIGALVAIPLGTIAAFYGRAGQVIMRVMDVFFAFPMVLLAILIAALPRAGPRQPHDLAHRRAHPLQRAHRLRRSPRPEEPGVRGGGLRGGDERDEDPLRRDPAPHRVRFRGLLHDPSSGRS